MASKADGIVAETIEQAATALDQKAEVFKTIGECRDLLHLLDSRGQLNEAQHKWLHEHLPRRARGVAEDNGAGE